MRIISGSSRGRKLAQPKNDLVRPTTDRVKESLFSILGDLHDLVVIDGFSGSGALGCEALSRGASFCYFFDNHNQSIQLTRENVSRIHAQDTSSIRKTSFSRGLSSISHTPDLVFLDPPYHSPDLIQRAFSSLSDSPHINADCTIVLEQESDEPLPDVDSFSPYDQRTYGRTRLSFWQRRDASF